MRLIRNMPILVATAWRRAEKCLRRTSSPASGVNVEASSVEPTRSVKSTVMFSVVATEPPVPATRRKSRRDQAFPHLGAIGGPDEGSLAPLGVIGTVTGLFLYRRRPPWNTFAWVYWQVDRTIN